LVFVEWLAIAGIACGAGLAVYLAALRGAGDRPPTRRQVLRPVLFAWIAGLLAAIVLPLPSFTAQYALGLLGAAHGAGQTLGNFLYRNAVLLGDIGTGSAVAMLILATAAAAGLIVGAMAVFGKLRLELVPPGKKSSLFSGGPARVKILFLALLALGFLNVLSTLFLNLAPLLGTLSLALKSFSANISRLSDLPDSSLWSPLLYMVLPPLAGVFLLQLPTAWLGALGIGAARPLGKRSEWLLLLFAPWLLVSTLPLSVAFFASRAAADNAISWTSLMPPIALSVPILFILTLFFKGREPHWRAALAAGKTQAAAFFRELVLPSLPLAALLGFVGLLLSTQDFFWQLITTMADPALAPAAVFLFKVHMIYGTVPELAATANLIYELPVFVFFLAGLGVFQAFYLDRLALTAGEPEVR
jgi:hypothetical protein